MKNLSKVVAHYGVVTQAGTNGQQFWTQQLSYLGKEADCTMMFPYGTHANLPPNDVLALFWGVEGHSENRVGMGWTPQLRPDLEPGEVAYYHPFSNSIATFRNNGDIDIDTVKDGDSNNININTNDLNITVEGDATIDVEGNATANIGINAEVNVSNNAELNVNGNAVVDINGQATIDVGGNTNFTTPNFNLTGNLNVDGNLDVTGSTTLSSSVTSGGVNISDTHAHPINSGSSAPGPTGPPQ